jgi:Tol biopolymer transport system component
MISVQNAAAFLVASLSILRVNSVAAQSIEPRKLMGTINEESSWSPDGKTIAFDSVRSGKLNIYTWRIDTRELKRITTTEANDFTPE